jgi:basic amino acid/polyamine antiporter, APA family
MSSALPVPNGGVGRDGQPRPTLRMRDVVGITVGIVIGAGIFRAPSLVAGAAGSAEMLLLAWVIGGVLSIIGALCYAELASAQPSAGGDYHYLLRAFGHRLAFLYAWARLTVIQTGSIALLAFIFGDYATQLFSLGPFSSAIYAAMVVFAVTCLNWIGVRFGTGVQNWLTVLEVAGLAVVIVAGLFLASPGPASVVAQGPEPSFGLMMVFVLLTFGGWNEAVYVSAELRDGRRRMGRAMVLSLIIVTLLYLLANLAYLRVLGLAGMAGTDAVAADVMSRAMGPGGGAIISVLIAVAALTSANATAITGARTAYALGCDFPALRWLGSWNGTRGTPANALIVQGMVAMLLVLGGSLSRDGFQTVVEYSAPVFWFFFLLVGISLFVLRRRISDAERLFRVPLYPLLPAIFCLTCAYLLYSSLAYTGPGAIVGVAVVALGGLLLPFLRPIPQEEIC